ncbi:MAG: hypothetical protein ACT4QA_13475 [Panacagrimonas sp.]
MDDFPLVFGPPHTRWKVGHAGKDDLHYEEFDETTGTWRRMSISAELAAGPAHHLIFFSSPEGWKRSAPAWARTRREQIVARIKWQCRAPGYEYVDVP